MLRGSDFNSARDKSLLCVFLVVICLKYLQFWQKYLYPDKTEIKLIKSTPPIWSARAQVFRPRGPEFCLSGWTNVNSPYHSKGLHSLVIPKINRNRFGKKKSPHHSVHLCNEFARRHPSFCAPSVTSSIWEQYRSEPLILPNVTGISVHGLVVVSTGTTKLQFII